MPMISKVDGWFILLIEKQSMALIDVSSDLSIQHSYFLLKLIERFLVLRNLDSNNLAFSEFLGI
jgi:hypothetical protein